MIMFSEQPSFWGDRLKASGLHLGLNLFVAALANGLSNALGACPRTLARFSQGHPQHFEGSKNRFWTVFVNASSAHPVAFLPLDSF